jgi:hypothetical protein
MSKFIDESGFTMKIGGIEIASNTTPGTLEGQIVFGDWVIINESGELVFKLNSVEKMRLNTSGIVGVSDSGSYQTFTYTSTNSDTLFSGVDQFGELLSYTVGSSATYLNGIRLVANTDYTAVTGNTVVFLEPTSNGDIITIETF